MRYSSLLFKNKRCKERLREKETYIYTNEKKKKKSSLSLSLFDDDDDDDFDAEEEEKEKKERNDDRVKENLRKVSRVLKKTLPSGVSIRQHISVSVCEKVGKGRKKKEQKTGRQKLTSLPATYTRSLQNEKRK